MLFVVSGEGPTDIGACNNMQSMCSENDFSYGPMMVLIDQIASVLLGYSPLVETPHSIVYISEGCLAIVLSAMKDNRRNVALPGIERQKETVFYHKNAMALSEITKEIEVNKEDPASVAVLFRDTDGTQSSPASLWIDKYSSMKSGFLRAEYDRGVPMLPKPKSEAWLLCSAKANPYQNCDALEDISGNDRSPNPAKQQLERALGFAIDRQSLVDWVNDNPPDLSANGYGAMPSFAVFKEDLEGAIGLARVL